MEFSQIKSEGLKKSYKIEIDGLEVEAKNQSKCAELKSQVNLPGFRPGKVPENYIAQKWGKQITAEIIDEIVNKSLSEIIEKEKLKLVEKPDIDVDEYIAGQNLIVKFSCEVFPELEEDVIDLSKVKFTTYDVQISDKDLDKYRQDILDQHAQISPYADEGQKAKKSDLVKVDFTGYINGKEFEGGSAKDNVIEIGSKKMIPGFEEKIIGLKKNDKKKFKITFPKNYHVTKYQDVEAEFDVTVKEISYKIPAKLDEELLKKLAYENAADFNSKTEKALNDKVKNDNLDCFKLDVFNYIEDKINFELPEVLLTREKDNLIKEYISGQGYKDEEEALKANEKDIKKQKKKYEKIANRRVKVGILLAELSKIKNLTVSDSDVIQSFNQQVANYPEEYKKSLFQYYQSNPQAFEYLRAPLLEEKVVEFLRESALLKAKKVSLEQFEKIYNSKD